MTFYDANSSLLKIYDNTRNFGNLKHHKQTPWAIHGVERKTIQIFMNLKDYLKDKLNITCQLDKQELILKRLI